MTPTLRLSALVLGVVAARGVRPCAAARTSGGAATSRAALGPIHALASPVGADGGEPRLSRDATGSLVLSWLEPVGDAGDFALKYARLAGDDWTGTAVAAQGRDWVISAADLPSVQALSERLWVADWRVPSPASAAAYDIRVAVSADAGATWSAPRAAERRCDRERARLRQLVSRRRSCGSCVARWPRRSQQRAGVGRGRARRYQPALRVSRQ